MTKKSGASEDQSAEALISQRIAELGDWRGKTLARMRKRIRAADPEIVEEWKWGVPVWSHGGIICTGESYKKVVKLTFAKGAALADPKKLFNSSLEGNVRRAIDLGEGEDLDEAAFVALVRQAVALNGKGKAKDTAAKAATPMTPAAKSAKAPTAAKTAKAASTAKPKTAKAASTTEPVKLLSGGNPQIAKADGDAPVQAYIAAMPGWKRAIGERLDALIERHVPNVRKAVRWNSPFYGVEAHGWFLSTHVLTNYVKVTFFAGAALTPLPPGGTAKSKDARWIDIYEDGGLDEAQMSAWVKQAAKIPGWKF